MLKHSIAIVMALLLLGTEAGLAAETKGSDSADISIRSARVETVRARLATVSSPSAAATMLDADDLLRQLKAAPADKRAALAAQLDAALTRAELEIDMANRPK